MAKLIGFICKTHGYINCEKYGYKYCEKCAQEYKDPIYTNGVTEYHTGLGESVNSKDIDRICKEKGLVYGGEDLTREAARNKEYNEKKYTDMFNNGLKNELYRGLA